MSEQEIKPVEIKPVLDPVEPTYVFPDNAVYPPPAVFPVEKSRRSSGVMVVAAIVATLLLAEGVAYGVRHDYLNVPAITWPDKKVVKTPTAPEDTVAIRARVIEAAGEYLQTARLRAFEYAKPKQDKATIEALTKKLEELKVEIKTLVNKLPVDQRPREVYRFIWDS